MRSCSEISAWLLNLTTNVQHVSSAFSFYLILKINMLCPCLLRVGGKTFRWKVSLDVHLKEHRSGSSKVSEKEQRRRRRFLAEAEFRSKILDAKNKMTTIQ